MTPEQQAIIVQQSIQGVPNRKIAQTIGIHESNVCRAKQQPDIKAKIEAGIQRLINRGLNPAINTLTRAAAMGTTREIKSTPDLYKISIDASKTILNHVSGSGPQTVINQLILQQSAPDTVREVSALQSFIDAQWAEINEPPIQNVNGHSEIETTIQDTSGIQHNQIVNAVGIQQIPNSNTLGIPKPQNKIHGKRTSIPTSHTPAGDTSMADPQAICKVEANPDLPVKVGGIYGGMRRKGKSK